ncbi:MAG: hypothetical protein GC150_16410 [Rhizobiales bacterium]|nr:hypothetical protein [Hyphomicrobiales bacterium]
MLALVLGLVAGDSAAALPHHLHGEITVRPAHRYWMHNGSRMELAVAGSQWVFRYVDPRGLMRLHGWRTGDELFRGSVNRGGEIAGEIGRESVTCGRIDYPASGWVSADGAKVVMTARAPDRATVSCRVEGHTDETLVFTAIAGE